MVFISCANNLYYDFFPNSFLCRLFFKIQMFELLGLYYIDYTLQNPGESRRYIYSAIGMANNGWYNRLYTVTGQVSKSIFLFFQSNFNLFTWIHVLYYAFLDMFLYNFCHLFSFWKKKRINMHLRFKRFALVILRLMHNWLFSPKTYYIPCCNHSGYTKYQKSCS